MWWSPCPQQVTAQYLDTDVNSGFVLVDANYWLMVTGKTIVASIS